MGESRIKLMKTKGNVIEARDYPEEPRQGCMMRDISTN